MGKNQLFTKKAKLWEKLEFQTDKINDFHRIKERMRGSEMIILIKGHTNHALRYKTVDFNLLCNY